MPITSSKAVVNYTEKTVLVNPELVLPYVVF